MHKRRLGLVLISIMSIVFVVLSLFLIQTNHTQKDEIKALENEKQVLIDNNDTFNYLNSLTIESFEQKVKSGEELFVYIGNSECPDCSFFAKTLEKEVKTFPLSNALYFVNGRELRQDKTKWLNFKKRYQFEQTPAFLIFSKGQLLSIIQWSEKSGLSDTEFHDWLLKNKQKIDEIRKKTL